LRSHPERQRASKGSAHMNGNRASRRKRSQTHGTKRDQTLSGPTCCLVSRRLYTKMRRSVSKI